MPAGTNSILTATAVTREALRVLHQKLNFVGTITRDYDESFARQGAKVGDTLKVRLPNQYTVRTGSTLVSQDTTESSVDLKVQTQKGVDLNFTSVDLTMALDDFSERILEPAMSVLAANIEADAMSMYKDVYNQVQGAGPATFTRVLQGRKILVDNLAPLSGRTCNLNTQDNVDLVDALKGLFNDKTTISKQNREGYMGRTAGFDFMENTLWPAHTVGTKAGTPLINGGSQATTYAASGANNAQSLITDGWTASSAILKQGDVFTIAGVFAVNPVSKDVLPYLQQFVVNADISADGSGNATLNVSPAIITTGAYQTVSAGPADNAAITVLGTAATNYPQNLVFHKNAFALVMVPMEMPAGVPSDLVGRETYKGISVRLVPYYDGANDLSNWRLDVLYAVKAIFPDLATRVSGT